MGAKCGDEMVAVARNSHEHLIGLGGTGSALEYRIQLTFFVKGPVPDGGVLSSPNFRLDVMDVLCRALPEALQP
ncbi:hypothetical protein ACDY96_16780 [Rhizobium mongolense]|uniref:hypothetical protein n=2 Tax=Rhizobium TaxID=379 RepID=UPI00355828B7